MVAASASPRPAPLPTRPAPVQSRRAPADLFEGLSDEALVQAIRQHAARHLVLAYGDARRAIFARVDNHDGRVTDVYTGRVVETTTPPDPSDINIEHTWPRANGVEGKAATSDLHHLFPVDSFANNKRANHGFGEVEVATWSGGESRLGKDALGATVFEPPDAHKGNVARALFYISDIYDLDIPDAEEQVLKRWNEQDPVDSAERARNDLVEREQFNRNPFVDDPSLAARIADF